MEVATTPCSASRPHSGFVFGSKRCLAHVSLPDRSSCNRAQLSGSLRPMQARRSCRLFHPRPSTQAPASILQQVPLGNPAEHSAGPLAIGCDEQIINAFSLHQLKRVLRRGIGIYKSIVQRIGPVPGIILTEVMTDALIVAALSFRIVGLDPVPRHRRAAAPDNVDRG